MWNRVGIFAIRHTNLEKKTIDIQKKPPEHYWYHTYTSCLVKFRRLCVFMVDTACRYYGFTITIVLWLWVMTYIIITLCFPQESQSHIFSPWNFNDSRIEYHRSNRLLLLILIQLSSFVVLRRVAIHPAISVRAKLHKISSRIIIIIVFGS